MSTNPKIIFNLQYRYTQYTKKTLNKKQEKKRINTKDALEYYDRDEACDKTINTSDAFDYYDYRIGSAGGFNEKGDIGAVQGQQLCDQYKPEVIYRGVLSFDKQFAIENGIIEKEKMKKLVQKSMNSILKRLDMNSENVIWCAFYHTNTAHPHCHINFYEKERTRKMERFPKKQLERVRSEIVSLLEVNTQMYIRKDEAFKALIDSVSHLDPILKEGLARSGNNSLSLKSKTKLINLLCKLEDDLPKSGSMKYNSKNIRPYHNQIRKIINEIFEDKEVKPFYDEYKEVLNRLKMAQENLYGDGISTYKDGNGNIVHGTKASKKNIDEYCRRQLYEVETRVANLIIQNIVGARKDMQIQMNVPHEEDRYEKRNIKQHASIKEIDADSSGDEIQKSKSIRKRNFKIRSKIIKAGVIRELAKDIQSMDYALRKEHNKVQEVTRKAQEEIYQSY